MPLAPTFDSRRHNIHSIRTDIKRPSVAQITNQYGYLLRARSHADIIRPSGRAEELAKQALLARETSAVVVRSTPASVRPTHIQSRPLYFLAESLTRQIPTIRSPNYSP